MTNEIRRGVLHQSGALLVVLTGVLDAALIAGSFLFILYANGIPFSKDYMLLLLAALLLFLCNAALRSLYRSQRLETIRKELGQILTFWGITISALAFILYVAGPRLAVNPDVLIFWFFSAPIPVLLVRVVIRTIAHQLRKNGRNFRNVAIIGATDIGDRIQSGMELNPWLGLHFAGIFDDRSGDDGRLDNIRSRGTVESTNLLFKQIEAGAIDIVYIALPMRAELRIKQIVDKLSTTHVSIYYAPDFYSFELLNARWDTLGGQPVISVIESPFVGDSNVLKRAEDLVITAAVLAVLAIPMMLVAVMVKLDSPGPAIYRQRRYGLDGSDFYIWKFRTMDNRASDKPFVQATQNDSRVTRLGTFLRKYSIDELPQFINVLQGTMSVIGPRPHPMALDDEHKDLIHRYNLRHKVKPGITGWAQVNGYRGETDALWKMEGRLKYDLDYINNWSLGFDLKILLMTPTATTGAKNAY